MQYNVKNAPLPVLKKLGAGFFGGERPFMTDSVKIRLQTMPANILAQSIQPYLTLNSNH